MFLVVSHGVWYSTYNFTISVIEVSRILLKKYKLIMCLLLCKAKREYKKEIIIKKPNITGFLEVIQYCVLQ